MCLSIAANDHLIQRDNLIFGYKLYSFVSLDSKRTRIKTKTKTKVKTKLKQTLIVKPAIRSTFAKFQLSKNKLIVSNRDSANITKEELNRATVHKGIHVYNTIELAKSAFNGCSDSLLVKVAGYSNDFVAKNARETVYHRIMPLEVLYFKKGWAAARIITGDDPIYKAFNN